MVSMLKASCLLVIVLLHVVVVCGDVLPVELDALQVLYDATDGPNWEWGSLIGKTRWQFNSTVSSDPCVNLWKGIKCDAQDLSTCLDNQPCRIESISLTNFNLFGTIPPEIGRFPYLKQLVLSENSLYGTIPSEIALLRSLQVLNVSYCNLNGTLPSTLRRLTSLEFLNLGGNDLVGTIPSSIGELVSIRFLYLFDNYFGGAIPTTIEFLSSLTYFHLSENYLTGPIPKTLSSCTMLEYISLSFNMLTGSLPHLGLTRLQHLAYNSNYFIGQMLPCYGDLANLTFFRLDDNYLSGTVPPELSKLCRLQTLLLFKNCLHGPIDQVFSSAQSALSVIDLSANALTGTLPTALFQLPALRIVSVVKNCFSGSIPEMCDANMLSIIALDGMTSGDKCKASLWDPLKVFSSYFAATVPGTIPSCIWSLPNITMVTMSGNGLHDQLPSDIELSDSLVDVDLSYNRLISTIPFQFQTHPFQRLDLSHNKLCGNIEDMLPNTTHGLSIELSTSRTILDLAVNRLTGFIPPTVQAADNVYVLEGNVFACKDNSDLPQSDPDHNTYVCGSDELESSFEFVGLFYGTGAFVILCFSFFLHFCRRVTWAQILDPMISYSQQIYAQQWALSNADLMKTLIGDRTGLDVSATAHFINILVTFRNLCGAVTLLACALCLPTYMAFYYNSNKYYSHEQQYGWVFSTAFLSGNLPAIVLLVLFTTIGSFVFIRILFSEADHSVQGEFRDSDLNAGYKDDCLSRHESYAEHMGNFDDLEFEEDSSRHGANQRQSLLSALSSSASREMSGTKQSDSSSNHCDSKMDLRKNPFFISGRDSMAIVRSTIQKGSEKANKALSYLIIFAINWAASFAVNAVYVFALTSGLTTEAKYFLQLGMAVFKLIWNVSFVRILINWLYPGRGRMQLHVLMLTFNNLIAPCLAIAVASKQCFMEIFTGSSDVESSYSFQYCQEASQTPDRDDQLVTMCTHYNDMLITTTFAPPFVYSYQCAPTLIVAYVPVFVYSYGCLAVFTPMFYAFLSNAPRKLLSLLLPGSLLKKIDGILRPQDAENETEFDYLLHAHSLIARYAVHLIILLTFGLAYPPLAVVIFLAVASSTLTWQIIISRFVAYSSGDPCSDNNTVTDRASLFSDRSSASISHALLHKYGMITSSEATDKLLSTGNPRLSDASSIRLFELEIAISGAWVNLRASNWLVMVCAMCFYMLQLFDMAGNSSVRTSTALAPGVWVPLAGFSFLVVVWLVVHAYQASGTRATSGENRPSL